MKVGATTKTSSPELMAWDGDWWGIRTAKAETLDGLSQWAVDNSVGLVYLLVDTADTDQLHQALRQGFEVMDTRVILRRRTNIPVITKTRPYLAEDVSRLRGIAEEAFQHTRFRADRRFNQDAVDALYSEWTRSACAGASEAVLVAERDDTPVGYVTVHLDPARIGLIAVACDYRGQGIGTELTLAAVHWAGINGQHQIEVATQAANIGALRTFENCGFRVSSSAYWLHKWYP